MYRRLQGEGFSTLQQGFDEVVVEFMTLYGQVSILKAWILRIIDASTQDLQLPELISKLGVQS